MPVETGVLQWLKWDTQAGAEYKCPGLVVGGQIQANSGMTVRRGIGDQSSPFAGPVDFRCSANIETTSDSKALLEYAIRAAGALTALKVSGGSEAYDFEQENAYINSMRLSGAVNSPLTAVLELMAKTETEAAAGGSPVALGSDLYAWQNAAVTIGSGYKCQAFEVNLNNNLSLYHSLDSKAATEKRLPTGINVGAEEITCSFDLLEKLTWDPDEDTPAVNLGAIVTYSIGENTITITLTNLAHTGARAMPFQGDGGLVVWRYEFLGIGGSLAIT